MEGGAGEKVDVGARGRERAGRQAETPPEDRAEPDAET